MRLLWCLLAIFLLTLSRVAVADTPEARHSLSLRGEFSPLSGLDTVSDGYLTVKGAQQFGVQGSYAYRITDSFSMGTGVAFRSFVGLNQFASNRSLSIPLLLVSLEPRLSDGVRLLMVAGIGYQRIWGGEGDTQWHSNGYDTLFDLGVSIRISPQVDLLPTVGVRLGSGIVQGGNSYTNAGHLLGTAFPIGIGLRYSP